MPNEATLEFNDAMDRDIRPILDAIDDIRPYVKNLADIANMLPAIVVVGDQSSGKSSLLESLSGVQLPRGAGICTRVPLELQLRNGDKFHARLEYQRELGEEKTVRDDVAEEDVADEINKATVEIAGGEKDICDTPIILRIEGPKYHNITLIDLPGEQTASHRNRCFQPHSETFRQRSGGYPEFATQLTRGKRSKIRFADVLGIA